MAKKYANLNTLQTFLDNLKNLFATKEEFSTHNHDSLYDVNGSADTALQTAQGYTDEAIAQKTQVQIITWGAED